MSLLLESLRLEAPHRICLFMEFLSVLVQWFILLGLLSLSLSTQVHSQISWHNFRNILVLDWIFKFILGAKIAVSCSQHSDLLVLKFWAVIWIPFSLWHILHDKKLTPSWVDHARERKDLCDFSFLVAMLVRNMLEVTGYAFIACDGFLHLQDI